MKVNEIIDEGLFDMFNQSAASYNNAANLNSAKARNIAAKSDLKNAKIRAKTQATLARNSYASANLEKKRLAEEIAKTNMKKAEKFIPKFSGLIMIIGGSLWESYQNYHKYTGILEVDLKDNKISQEQYEKGVVEEKNIFITTVITLFGGSILVNFILAFISAVLIGSTGAVGFVGAAIATLGRFLASGYLIEQANKFLNTDEGHNFCKSIAEFFIEPNHDAVQDILSYIKGILESFGIPKTILEPIFSNSPTTTSNKDEKEYSPEEPNAKPDSSTNTQPQQKSNIPQQFDDIKQQHYPGIKPTGDIAIWQKQYDMNEIIKKNNLGNLIPTDGIDGPLTKNAEERINNFQSGKSSPNPNDGSIFNPANTTYNKGSGIKPSVTKDYYDML